MELGISARVSSVSDTDATITYSYTLPFALEDAALTIDLLDSKGSVVATDSDNNSRNFTLSGLEPSTTYAYTVRLTATPAEGETQNSRNLCQCSNDTSAGQESRWYGYIDASVPQSATYGIGCSAIFEYELISWRRQPPYRKSYSRRRHKRHHRTCRFRAYTSTIST